MSDTWRSSGVSTVVTAALVAAALASTGGRRAVAEPVATRPEVTAPYQIDGTYRETVVSVPVRVRTLDKREHDTEFLLSHARPVGDGPFPLVIINHGRNWERSYPSRSRIAGSASYYFLRRGFAVFVPTRVGYGGLGTRIDPERGASGCGDAGATQQIDAVDAHVRATIAYAKTQSWIDPQRIILAGQSVGGYTAIAVAARQIDGVIAAVNFSGGAGANAKGPAYCPERMMRVFAAAGKAIKVPTLWIYGDNDQYWGRELPRAWHKAFIDAGGSGAFVGVPFVPVDGHSAMSQAGHVWRSHADAFLAPFGAVRPTAKGALPPSGFANIGDFAMLRSANPDVVPSYRRFLNSDVPRAFAFSPNGGWAFRSGGDDPVKEALESCAKTTSRPCKLYAVDDNVVWRP